MKNVFVDWPRLSKKIISADKKLVLFDFDGTLSQIVSHPDKARLDERLLPFLSELSKLKKTNVGIVSGRSLQDLKKRIGMPGFLYAGNHGLEASGPGRQKFLHPKANKIKKTINRISLLIKMVKIKGLVLENKGLSLSVHFRSMATSSIQSLRNFFLRIEPVLHDADLKVRSGKKVFEVIPNVGWNKGNIVAWFKKETKASLVIYAGDDSTDDDVFRRFQLDHVMVLVGRRPGFSASHFLFSQKDVLAFLRRLVLVCQS